MCAATVTLPAAPKMFLSNTLAELAPRLLASAAPDSVGEPKSLLQHVRHSACLGDRDLLGTRLPVLLDESMHANSFFLYNTDPYYLLNNNADGLSSNPNDVQSGNADLQSFGDLRVAGGAILETQRCSFPIVILLSKDHNTLLLHASNAPVAALEAEYHDSASSDQPPLLTKAAHTARTSLPDLRESRAAASKTSRSVAFRQLPSSARGSGNVHFKRNGVVPFLSLRAAASQTERNLLGEHLQEAMAVFPTSEEKLLKLVNDDCATRDNLLLQSIISSGTLRKHEDEENLPTVDEIRPVLDREVIVPIAVAILEVVADSHSAPGTQLALPRAEGRVEIIESSLLEERRAAELAKKVKETDLCAELARDDAFTLGNVMQFMGRCYTTKLIADFNSASTEREAARLAVTEVAASLFAERDASNQQRDVASVAEKAIEDLKLPGTNSKRTAVHLALKRLGALVSPVGALVIVLREADGRFLRASWHNSECCNNNELDKCSLARISCLLTNARVLIVDSDAVLEVLVKDDCFAKEKLRLASTKSDQSVSKIEEKMDTLCALLESTAAQLEETKTTCSSLISEVSQLKVANVELSKVIERKADAVQQPPEAPARKRGALWATLELVECLNKAIRLS